MRRLWKLGVLTGINVLMALSAAPAEVQAAGTCSMCYVAYCESNWYHAFLWDNLQCQNGGAVKVMDNSHVGQSGGMCTDNHEVC